MKQTILYLTLLLMGTLAAQAQDAKQAIRQHYAVAKAQVAQMQELCRLVKVHHDRLQVHRQQSAPVENAAQRRLKKPPLRNEEAVFLLPLEKQTVNCESVNDL
jgi:hypothetical protein